MAAAKTSPKKAAAKKPAATKTAAKSTAAKASKAKAPAAKGARMSLAEAMSALEKAGSEPTRKTCRRHGAVDPMFGVSFATLKTLVKRIGVDHDLAPALLETGNHDAQILAVKIADPARDSGHDLELGVRTNPNRIYGWYVCMIVAHNPADAATAAEALPRPEGDDRAALRCFVGEAGE